MTVFEKEAEQVQEIKPGTILVVRANGATEMKDLLMTQQGKLVAHSNESIFLEKRS